MSKVLVLGGGGFGTCLANLLTENGNDVYLWEHNGDVREMIRKEHENKVYLPGIKLSEKLNVIDDYNSFLEKEKPDYILLATPSQFLRKLLKNLKKRYNLWTIYDRIGTINFSEGELICPKQNIKEFC